MPANRFFSDVDLKIGSPFLIEGPEHHHLVHVMRIMEGEEVEIVNGRGSLGLGKVLRIDKKSSEIYLLRISHESPEESRFFLATPFMRPSKLEWVVEKGTELGASGFYFYSANYSEKGNLSSRNMERFHLLTIAALKQSGRLYLPTIDIVSSLERLFVKEAVFLFGDLRTNKLLRTFPKAGRATVFITGPEKGFASEELALLDAKAQGIRLSRYILRAETASIAAASILGTIDFDLFRN